MSAAAAVPPGMTAELLRKTLSHDNAGEFWTEAWAKDVTGWRRVEEVPCFTRHLYVFARGRPGLAGESAAVEVPYVVTPEMHAAATLNGAAEEATVRQFLAGKTVLVPLCGDTAALRYMVDHGAAVVVGADLAEEALRHQRQTRFADVAFTCTEVLLEDGSVVKVYEGRCGEGRVRLFEGDYLKLPQLPLYHDTPVDFVYDRAAFMAMHPTMRKRYVHAVSAVMTPVAGALVERPVRDDGDGAGPPFTFTTDEVQALYEAETRRGYSVSVMLENRWFGVSTPGSVHYFDFFRLEPRV